jgi:peptidoglycan/LPS O-acetylase OafA/YrhL
MTWSRLPPMHLPLFLMGAWLGTAYRTKAGKRSGIWILLGGAGSVALLCLAPTELQEPARRGLLAMSYASLIYGLASARDGWLTSRWMVLGGEISYSIYILQMPVMRTVLGVTRRLGMGYYGGVAAVLAALIPLSFLAYRFVELPARVAIRNRLSRVPVTLEKI